MRRDIMKYRKSVLSTAIVTCIAFGAQAQDAGKQPSPTDLDTVQVVGIRGSMEKSLDAKREAQSHVEVVTAEDIGKLPARNVADTLQRLPGVNISSSSANEGGFDESDRVSLRGTTPSLTLTQINGHTIGSADWFILSQTETVGRSVSYSLLPSEMVSQVVVHKSSEAKLNEGGSAGTVDVITRKPLEFADPFHAEASVGAVYSDLPDTTKPQFSGLVNWKNEANNFGVLFQAFYQERELRRDGQEIVGGFSQIAADAPVVATNPDLAGVYYPNLPGAVYFDQTRERKGGLLGLQLKATDTLTLGLEGFVSKMDAKNYNRNYMLWTGNFANTQAPNPGYVIKDNTLVKADYAGVAGTGYGIYDMISRPESSADTQYVTFDADWQASDMFNVKFQGGTTEGKGKTPLQDIAEVVTGVGQGGGWQVNGTGSPTNWYLGGDNSSPAGSLWGGTWGAQNYEVTDKEHWAKADGQLYFGTEGVMPTLDFGVRYADHTREVESPYGWDLDGDGIWANLQGSTVGHYPGNFGNGIGGTFPSDIWYFTQGALRDAVGSNSTLRNDGARRNWASEFKVNEKTTAAYVQANLEGDDWSANFGVRYVDIDQDIDYNRAVDAAFPGAITTSLFGPYIPVHADNEHKRLLPSANIKFQINDDTVFRVAASQTMTLPDYSALAGAVSLSNLTHTGSGGNSDLDPIISSNVDASLEWYFAPRALLSASVYSMDLRNYVKYDTVVRPYVNDQTGNVENYEVTIPVNSDGRVRGLEISYEQPIGDNFGFSGNYTYADGEADDGGPLVGTSKNTYNGSLWFENDTFNARVAYTFRSSFYHGMLRANEYFQDDTGTLAASVGYKFNDWFSLTLDGLNLNNPKLKYYVADGRPQAFYTNGRQYYLNARFSF
jgi:iron complex outermembrane receptor protein